MVPLFATLLLIAGCGNKKENSLEREEAEFQTVVDPEPSIIEIPLRIEVAELEQLIEQQMTNLNLAEGASGDDRLELSISKADEPIRIEVFNEQIRYRVPLGLDIAYDIGIAKPKAKGILALDFRSDFRIDSTWQLTTTTQLNNHEWVEEPKLKMAGFSLPITSIGNYAIRQAEGTIERAIDLAVKEQIALQNYVTDAWNQLQQPLLVSEEEQAWLMIRPTDLRMTPLQADDKAIRAGIILEALPQLSFGASAPSELPRPFPAFAYAEAGDQEENFTLNLGTNLAYAEAERLAGASVLGEQFSSGDRAVTVEGIKLFGKAGKLLVELTTSGSYNGSIYLSGLPVYDADKGRLKIKDLDFTLKTKSFLAKSAAWLLKGKLKRQLQDNMNEMLSDNLADLRDELQKELTERELAPGISIGGQLNQLSLADTYLTEEGIQVVIRLSGKLDLNITGLTQLLPNE